MSPITSIGLDQLHAHRANSNVMPKALFKKLVLHIKRTGRYPPILVRPWKPAPGDSQQEGYQILDGHHRVAALRELGYIEAQCMVWEVDDAEALLLLATLNRLQGQDDPLRRAELIGELTASRNLEALAAQLPDTVEHLEKLLALRAPPAPPRLPAKLDEMPVAVHFFLLPAQRRQLESTLAKIGPTREAALLSLCRVLPNQSPLAV